jgi:hypothetical protein
LNFEIKHHNNMMRKFIKTLLLATLVFVASPQNGFAEWTSWEKIKNLKRVGKALAKAGRVPVTIQCKRGPGF